MDNRKDIEVELTDDEFLQIAKMAHDRDITFNKMVEIMLDEFIKEQENGTSND
jgi:hypothetical protein